MSNSIMKIDNLKIKMDAEGRYCLNDLHKAAMASNKAVSSQRPGNFLKSSSINSFVQTLTDATKIASVVTIKGGREQGTYADELVAIRYAAWIDPVFEIKVYESFQQSKKSQIELAQHQQQREKARLESRFMNDAIKYSRTDKGQEVKHYHFSNEYDLINRIALGMSAKQFRVAHGLAANESIRDYLSPMEMACITHLQSIDTGLIEAGLSYEQRKSKLSRIYTQRYFGRLCDEVKRLEA